MRFESSESHCAHITNGPATKHKRTAHCSFCTTFCRHIPRERGWDVGFSEIREFAAEQKIIEKMFGGIEKISTYAPFEPAKPLNDAQIGGSFVYMGRGRGTA